MDEEVYFGLILLAAVVGISITKKRRRQRRYGVRPINRCRKELGMYNKFVKAMINQDREYFYNYSRMSPEMFAYLLKLVKPRLTKLKTTKTPISAGQRLIITLQ